MNEVTLTGNVTEDPKVRVTPSGSMVANFGLAVNRQYNDRNGQKVEKVTFYQVSAWNDMAQNIAESVQKGARVVVQGYIETEDWTDREGGKRTSLRLTANEVAVSLRWATAAVTRKASSGPRAASGAAPAGSDPYGSDQGHFGMPSNDEPF